MDRNTRISELTVGELMDLMEAVARKQVAQNPTVFGIQGLAEVFGCSVSQAKRIKASGCIDKAISQRGRTIMVDVELARKLWAAGTQGKRISNR